MIRENSEDRRRSAAVSGVCAPLQSGVRLAVFLGGAVLPTAGTLAADVIPWIKSFANQEENIEVPLSPLTATLTPSEVVRRAAVYVHPTTAQCRFPPVPIRRKAVEKRL